MIFVFGTKYLGGVKRYYNQEIQTKFAHFCFIPLFPVESESLLVTESDWSSRKGIHVKLNGTSILAGYARIPLMMAAIGALIYGISSGSALGILAGVVATGLAIYMNVYFGRSTPEESLERELLGGLTGIYARAVWLSKDLCFNLYERLSEAYEATGRNWKADLNNGSIGNADLLYGIALLHHAMNKNEESSMLLEKANAFYTRMNVSSDELVAAN
jgi:hypothetical protein